MSIVQLTARQRRELRDELHRARQAGYYRRLLAVLELDRGLSVAAVVAALGVTRQSVYNWAGAFAACPDPAVLQDLYGIGRPSLWTPKMEALLLTSLQECPADVGLVGVNWTVALLQEHLYRRSRRWLSGDTIRRALGCLGYVWKRFRYVLPLDPLREKKTPDPPVAARPAAPHCQAG
jgi:transposase